VAHKKFYIILLIFSSLLLKGQERETIYLSKTPDKGETDFYHLSEFGNIEKKSITYIAQDSIGQMWFASKDGLLRYDTKKFYTYKKESNNPNSIGGIFVERIFVGKDGTVWIGTEPAVLSKYHPKTDDFETVAGISGKRVKGIQQDKEGLYWITTDKTLYSYEATNKILNSYHYSDLNIGLDRLLITKNNQIFITTNEHFFLEFNPKTSEFKKIKMINKEDVKHTHQTSFFSGYYLIEDYKGFIWFTTSYGYILRYNPNSTEIKKFVFEKSLKNIKRLDYNKITSMFIIEDAEHNLWFGTWFNGLYKLSEDRKTLKHFMPEQKNKNSLTSNIIHSGFQDNAGYMWFGSEFTGLNILKKNKKFSINHQNLLNAIAYPKLIEAIVVDDFNRVWLATEESGLYYFEKSSPNQIKNANSLLGFPLNTWVFSLLYDTHGFLWIGTNKGLYKYNPQTKKKKRYQKKPTDYNSIASDLILNLTEDKNGAIWIGTNNGVTKFNTQENKFYRFSHDDSNPNSLSNNATRSIFCDSNNDIWIGTFSGLNKFNPSTGDFRVFKQDYKKPNSLSANRINTLQELNGSLWVGTQGGGLNKLDLDSKDFVFYNKKNGFPSDNIKGITNDEHGNLWMSTSNTIIKFNTRNKEYVTYGKSDGLESKEFINASFGWQDLEFNTGIAYKDKTGFLYFGGFSGMTFFHPDSLPQNNYAPPIAIDKFLVNGKPSNFEEKIVLKPKQNHIELSITSLNYIQPDKNRYAFYLENHDSIWQQTGSRNKIEYFNLASGTYLLHYKGSNNDNIWSKPHDPLNITILPYFYQTKIFYFSILLFFVLLILSFFLHRLYIKKKIKNQREKLRYSSSNLSEKEIKLINSTLIEKLNTSTLYLEPDINLNSLSSILKVKPNNLSQVINQVHKRNFNEFINLYRLEEAKKLLKETDLKIEAVAYDSGFNSLTTFNSFFKKEMTITPSNYRKQNK